MYTMKKLIEEFPKQLQRATAIGQQATLKKPEKPIHNIVIAGLGGSGIGGDLIHALTGDFIKVPVIISKSYNIPAFINENTLFIACSFSGSTEETLSAIEKAVAQKANMVCISSGGKVIELAQNNNWNYIQIPNEAPCPRAFLGYSMTQLLYVLYHLGFIDLQFENEMNKAIELISKDISDIQNLAQKLAQGFVDKMPIIYADSTLGAVCTRLQQQINENSKQLCHVNVLPEMNHNELVGWGLDQKHYQNMSVLIIHTSFQHQRVSRRFEISKKICEEKAFLVNEVSAKGGSVLEQNIYLIHLFDWISFYLAEKNNIDPFPVEVINYLKNELAKVEA